MNVDPRRELHTLLSTFATALAGEPREAAFEKVVRWVDSHAAGLLSRCVDAGTAVEVNNDTQRALAESLTALLYAARTAAEDLGRRLPTAPGREAARFIGDVLGRGEELRHPIYNGSLAVDSAELASCSGPIADIDESLRPHVEAPAEAA